MPLSAHGFRVVQGTRIGLGAMHFSLEAQRAIAIQVSSNPTETNESFDHDRFSVESWECSGGALLFVKVIFLLCILRTGLCSDG